jgi:hypothetical protein
MLANLNMIQWLFLGLCFFISASAVVVERSHFIKEHNILCGIIFVVGLLATLLVAVRYVMLPPMLVFISIWLGSYILGAYYKRVDRKAARALETNQIAEAYQTIAEALIGRENEEAFVTLDVTSWSQVTFDAGLKYALDSGLIVIVEKHYRDNTTILRLSGAIQSQILPIH